ncbi:hypothetical protein KsCSTR_16950 [Candidatus Kuenenia stuttgartiensis]|uniref:Uncharacterized protein n=1 Tax=Kuenenia stuttgartiensis TaxID=174633 RepID=Q1Q205_KUEST|nr:hypothetical protein KsCSTR_16950 [Candidatus Kuenenia stuttgartiensis]CAJ74043.1 unknown protein [Candidatus Kuenenia stuttgartiensis]
MCTVVPVSESFVFQGDRPPENTILALCGGNSWISSHNALKLCYVLDFYKK